MKAVIMDCLLAMLRQLSPGATQHNAILSLTSYFVPHQPSRSQTQLYAVALGGAA